MVATAVTAIVATVVIVVESVVIVAIAVIARKYVSGDAVTTTHRAREVKTKKDKAVDGMNKEKLFVNQLLLSNSSRLFVK